MLIVIVIIGILIAALMPRMQSAQWRARDVSRKNALSQIQTAIITSQQDKWTWPDTGDQASSGMSIADIAPQLKSAWMSSIPSDPNKDNVNYGLGNKTVTWEYLYMVATRNWVPKWGFVLMAKTEVEWWSNWVVCSNGGSWTISNIDLKEVKTCQSFQDNTDVAGWNGTCAGPDAEWKCQYGKTEQLRYILLY